MRMTEIQFDEQRPVEGYGPGGFRIAGEWRAGSLLLTPWGVRPMEGAPSPESLAAIIAAEDPPDVLLVGMGADIAPLPRALRLVLEERGIGYEVMSTPSACRTYNVLLTEARRVAAALVAL